MRSITCLALALTCFAACSGEGGETQDASIIDSWTVSDEGLVSCNPIAPPGQQGCLSGEKCSWIRVTGEPDLLGALRCVPDGSVALGGACTTGTPGESSGYDDCAAGLYCVQNVCQDICGFDGSAHAACAAGHNCTRYANTFANGDDAPIAGICNPGCDPLTQTKIGTNPPEGCGAGNGCYLLSSPTDTIAVCARAGIVMHDRDITGSVYANSCVPGAQSRRKDQVSQTIQCGGLCNVVDVSMGLNTAAEGGEATASTTDIDTCQGTWGAAPPSDGTAGESCRYWWARESFDHLTEFSNAVGWCFKHAVFRYDTNGDQMVDTPLPRCTTLTGGDVLPPMNGVPDNLYFWCVAAPPQMLAGAMQSIKQWHARQEPRLDRLVDWSLGQ